MIKWPLFLILFFALCLRPALADAVSETVSKIEYALSKSQFESIESIARQVSPFELRTAYRQLFDVARTQRLNEVKAWHASSPDSPHALTALAMQHQKRAFLRRGAHSSNLTSPEAFSAFREEIALARSLSDAALVLDPDFVPALETSLRLSTATRGDDSTVALTERLIALSPQREFLQIGLDAASFRWGGSIAENLELCIRLAAKVEGYDSELCLIEVAFRNDMKGVYREKAVAFLENRTEEFLDYARIEVFLDEWKHRPNAADEAIRLHSKLVQKATSPERVNFQLSIISTIFKRPFYEFEARNALRDRVRDLLKNDPENHRLASYLVDDIINYELPRHTTPPEEIVDELASLWPKMYVLGRHNYSVWQAGRKILNLRNGSMDSTTRQRFTTNAIYYSNHHPSLIKNEMGRLYFLWKKAKKESNDQQDVNKVDFDSRVLCPMVRVSRLYESICQRDPKNNGCTVGGWDAIYPEHVRRIVNRATQCREYDGPLQSLYFNPVTVNPKILEEGIAQ